MFESQEAAKLKFKPLIALMQVSKFGLICRYQWQCIIILSHTSGGKLHQRKGLADLEAARWGRVSSGPEGAPDKTILSENDF